MTVRKSATPIKYNNDLNGSKHSSNESDRRKNERKKSIKPMSCNRRSEHRTSNADSVAEHFLAT